MKKFFDAIKRIWKAYCNKSYLMNKNIYDAGLTLC